MTHACRDSCICGFMCGADVPPVRLSSVRTIQRPSADLDYVCDDVDCHNSACLGNRLERVLVNGAPCYHPSRVPKVTKRLCVSLLT